MVAKKLNRHYLGIEIDEQYCLWTEQRLEMAEKDREIQGYVDGVFWERNTLSEQNVPNIKEDKNQVSKQSKKRIESEQMTLESLLGENYV